MEVRYIGVYKVRSINKLPGEDETIRLLTLDQPALTATLTTNAEPYFLHIDKSSALASQLGKGFFAADKGSQEERLAREIDHVKQQRAKQTEKGIFLVFDGGTEIPEPEFKNRRDTDEFSVCLDAVDKSEIRELFRLSVERALTALSLSLPLQADHRIEKIGDVIYLVDADSGKPIYTFSIKGGFVRISTASPLTLAAVEETTVLASCILDQSKLMQTISLLIASQDRTISELQGFITAWCALEIFVKATFNSVYKVRWVGTPPSEKPELSSLEKVENNQYKLAQKFLIIAWFLNSDSASEDEKEFRRLKKFRDKLFHEADKPEEPLPTEAIQKLSLKYMRLHLLASSQRAVHNASSEAGMALTRHHPFPFPRNTIL